MQKYLGIQEARSENSIHHALDSSTYTSILWDPLPPSKGFRYCLACVDRFSKWPEAFPLAEISAEAVTKVFYTGWISRFGPSLILTTNQRMQFELSLSEALSKFLGTEKRHTTPYHPAANGQVEKFHLQAIMAHGSAQ
ncbi:retrovirus-related Pol polyprotein from transposon 412 [Nephila pilipes]|uniref:Retrovirus-related Pol polyprotein from transposon 412 n=1 Tax=Nephila pilipes TaxID=299642 RepID=A0A8X6J825_NEPPI|nr:retrovirus-related Pol polyprotein from transposon 412 [Nephila pilipes]